MAGATAQELAVRTKVDTVADPTTLLQKVDSPGRLYSPITKTQLKIDLGLSSDDSPAFAGLVLDDLSGVLKASEGVVVGAANFLDLSDTPASYDSADIGKILKVKDDLSGLEYTDSPVFTDIRLNGHGYFNEEVDNGNSGAADTIDWTEGNKQKSILTDDCIFTFTSPSGPCNLVLKLVQDGTGGRTVTWPGSVNWTSGTAPTLSTGASNIDIICFYFDGVSYFGSAFLSENTFLDLTDTPASYDSTDIGKYVKVKDDLSGLEFDTPSGDGGEASLSFVIDGGGSTITTGVKGDLEVPFDCTITAVTLLADQSGSIKIDIWKDSYGNFPPEDGDTITGANEPEIDGAVKDQDATLTSWTTTLSKGDVLRFNVDSVTDIQRVTLSLKVDKT